MMILRSTNSNSNNFIWNNKKGDLIIFEGKGLLYRREGGEKKQKYSQRETEIFPSNWWYNIIRYLNIVTLFNLNLNKFYRDDSFIYFYPEQGYIVNTIINQSIYFSSYGPYSTITFGLVLNERSFPEEEKQGIDPVIWSILLNYHNKIFTILTKK